MVRPVISVPTSTPWSVAAPDRQRRAPSSMSSQISSVPPRTSYFMWASDGTTLAPVPAFRTPTFTKVAPWPWRGRACSARVAWQAASSALRPCSGAPPACAATPRKRASILTDERKWVASRGHLSQRKRRPAHVEAGEIVGIVHDPGLHHGVGAAAAFLRRLEQKLDAAAPVRGLGQQLGGAQSDGHMGVVSAGVHDRGFSGCESPGHRLMGRVGGLGHLGGVHVEAQRHGGAGATLQNAHGPGDLDVPGHAAGLGPALLHHRVVGPPAHGVRMDAVRSRLHAVSQLPQPVYHHAGGAELGPAGLRVAVEAATDLGHGRELALRLPGQLLQVFGDVLRHDRSVSTVPRWPLPGSA